MKRIPMQLLLLAAFAALFTVATNSSAQNWTETLNITTPGYYLTSPVTIDSAGNLYSATTEAGTVNGSCSFGCGLVYKVAVGAHRKPEILYKFEGSDGAYPTGHLILNANGKIYGAANYGDVNEFGGVYELSPPAIRYWTETSIYDFANFADGYGPNSLVSDSRGNLFGSTFYGGAPGCVEGFGCGTLFELLPDGSGGWTKATIYTFTDQADGSRPVGQLTLDSQGNIYGTTLLGGAFSTQLCSLGCGTVFKLSPQSGGTWNFSTLYTFDGTTAFSANGSLALDETGNLFGTTRYGGAINNPNCAPTDGCGIVFELSPTQSGWTETTLHSFVDGVDGAYPAGGLSLDSEGNLYGAVAVGDTPCDNGALGCGAIYEISPTSGGNWTFQHIYTFHGPNGFSPVGDLTLDSAGNLYGTAAGSTTQPGNLFEISPPAHN
jgi:hypothetical protein